MGRACCLAKLIDSVAGLTAIVLGLVSQAGLWGEFAWV